MQSIDTIDVPSAAKNGVSQFMGIFAEIKSQWSGLSSADVISTILKLTKYKEYLIKEEGNDSAAEEKYDNIGQLINMAGKYSEYGEESLRQFMEEVTLLADAADNSDENADAIKLMTTHSSK